MRKNLTGLTFGKLTVDSIHSKTRNGHIRYTCTCTCGRNNNILGTHLIQGNTTSCGCDRPIGKTHAQWTGIGELSGDFWSNHIVRSASGEKGRRTPLELSIDKEYAWNLYLKQDRKCALSNIPICFPKKNKDTSYTASLDRIDSSLGYIEGNVQWVHKDINIMKNKFENNYFIEVCKKIANNNICEVV